MPPANVSADLRRDAARALARVEARGAHAARLLGAAPPFLRELVLGVLRWQGTLDAVLCPRLRGPLAGLDPEVRAILRAGLYEAKRLDTPAPVAVAEAVRVAKALTPRAAGLVNAVLRRAVADPWPDPDDASVPLAARISHPDWLIRRWTRELGPDLTRAVLEADQRPAALAVVGEPEEIAALRAQGCTAEPHPWVAGVFLVREQAATAVRALAAGRVYAMDAAAVLVARLVPAGRGLAADLAAAPGGKSLVLAGEQAQRPRLACDRQIGRVTMMRANFGHRLHPPWLLVADAARPALRPGSCEAVLLDAPCSGTGTLRRHPEIRWRLAEHDLTQLAALQRRLALAAAELLAPGGRLLYATCSLEPEENAGVVAGLPLEPVPIGTSLPAAAPRVELASGGVLLPPGADNDGFTVHLLRRA